MEKRFRITVDGRPYSVTVEDLSEGGNSPQPQQGSSNEFGSPVAAPAVAAAAIGSAVGAVGRAGPGDVVATLGGVVEAIVATVGQAVSQGDKVVVLDAMKMKAPMFAPISGKVTGIAVRVGESVEVGQVLATIS
jgi:biotin carboxyl carrier protein